MYKLSEILIRYLLQSAVIILFAITIIFIPPSYGKNKNKIIKYVGTDACKDCHPSEYENFFKYAKKSKSFQSIERVKKNLTEKEIKKCYNCHTTGYGKAGGFISPEKTPHLKGAGCEVCHGPGELHVKTTDRKYIKVNLKREDCEACHISERVQAFRFKPLIHGGAH